VQVGAERPSSPSATASPTLSPSQLWDRTSPPLLLRPSLAQGRPPTISTSPKEAPTTASSPLLRRRELRKRRMYGCELLVDGGRQHGGFGCQRS
jgi:hypothetical protein